MAFTSIIGGDRFVKPEEGILPAHPTPGFTPVDGDLTKPSSTVSEGVTALAAGDQPQGVVVVSGRAGEPVTDWRPAIAGLTRGTTIHLPYTGTVVRGDKVVSAGAGMDTRLKRTKVKADALGTGLVVAVDGETSLGPGYCLVRF